MTNPLSGVEKLKCEGQETRLRRAFSDSELKQLLAVSPDYRSIVYLTAARTGLRQAELAKLKWGDINLSSKIPHILARASITKNSTDARIPLTIHLERELLKHRPEDWKPDHKVFPKGVPRARTLRIDLEKAGIPYQDEMDRYLDFHSLRYSWATFLQRKWGKLQDSHGTDATIPTES